ncbi:hypothetical protein P24_09971 [Oceanibaculum indicum P24]|uniref:Uncharacterized protein n=1 Tax=Oceanibaculum indicum P24 TaxID=1207063 RepID=K2JYY5_9PROT|nr:hypothetical protein P24_09971 [Oceanibaculum indicum P24]
MLVKAASQKTAASAAILDADVQVGAPAGTCRRGRLLRALLCPSLACAAGDVAGGLEIGGSALRGHLGLLLFGAQTRDGE